MNKFIIEVDVGNTFKYFAAQGTRESVEKLVEERKERLARLSLTYKIYSLEEYWNKLGKAE